MARSRRDGHWVLPPVYWAVVTEAETTRAAAVVEVVGEAIVAGMLIGVADDEAALGNEVVPVFVPTLAQHPGPCTHAYVASGMAGRVGGFPGEIYVWGSIPRYLPFGQRLTLSELPGKPAIQVRSQIGVSEYPTSLSL